MLEARTQENKPFRIFCMKEPDYVMNIMASWMTLDEVQSTKTRRDPIDSSGTNETKLFTYRHPFGLNFKYTHQVYDHNNQRHAPIYLENTWDTKFWTYHNFSWYIAVS